MSDISNGTEWIGVDNKTAGTQWREETGKKSQVNLETGGG